MLGAINFTSLGRSNCISDVIANVPYMYCTMGVLGLRNGCLQILTFVCIGRETTLSKGQAILFHPLSDSIDMGNTLAAVDFHS